MSGIRDTCPHCGEQYIIFKGNGPETCELCGGDMMGSETLEEYVAVIPEKVKQGLVRYRWNDDGNLVVLYESRTSEKTQEVAG